MKQRLRVFTGFTVTAVLVLSILCYLEKFGILDFDVVYAGQVLSLVPATGIAAAGIFDEEYRKINQLFRVCFGVMGLLLLLNIFGVLNGKTVQNIGGVVIFVGSLLLLWWYQYGKENEERRFFHNFDKIEKDLIFLILVLWLNHVVWILLFSNEYMAIVSNLLSVIEVPFVILVCGILYWGEEYAWRGFLQELLQKKFGKRWGIVVLGVIWETYHCPLWFTVYDLHLWEVGMRYFLAITLSFALGYLYRKTGNIWAPIFGHAGYNVLGNLGIIDLRMGTAVQIVASAILGAFFLLFALKKEYQENEI